MSFKLSFDGLNFIPIILGIPHKIWKNFHTFLAKHVEQRSNLNLLILLIESARNFVQVPWHFPTPPCFGFIRRGRQYQSFKRFHALHPTSDTMKCSPRRHNIHSRWRMQMNTLYSSKHALNITADLMLQWVLDGRGSCRICWGLLVGYLPRLVPGSTRYPIRSSYVWRYVVSIGCSLSGIASYSWTWAPSEISRTQQREPFAGEKRLGCASGNWLLGRALPSLEQARGH